MRFFSGEIKWIDPFEKVEFVADGEGGADAVLWQELCKGEKVSKRFFCGLAQSEVDDCPLVLEADSKKESGAFLRRVDFTEEDFEAMKVSYKKTVKELDAKNLCVSTYNVKSDFRGPKEEGSRAPYKYVTRFLKLGLTNKAASGHHHCWSTSDNWVQFLFIGTQGPDSDIAKICISLLRRLGFRDFGILGTTEEEKVNKKVPAERTKVAKTASADKPPKAKKAKKQKYLSEEEDEDEFNEQEEDDSDGSGEEEVVLMKKRRKSF